MSPTGHNRQKLHKYRESKFSITPDMENHKRRTFLIGSSALLTGLAGCTSQDREEGTIILKNPQQTTHTIRLEIRDADNQESDITPLEDELAAGEVEEYTAYIDSPGRYRVIGFLDGDRAGTANVRILTNTGNGQYVTATVSGADNLRVHAHDIGGPLSGFWDRV